MAVVFQAADLIDRGRAVPASKRPFEKESAGVLMTDPWAAYEAVVAARKPKVLPHLMRDRKRAKRYHGPGEIGPPSRESSAGQPETRSA